MGTETMRQTELSGQDKNNSLEDALRQKHGELAALIDRLADADGAYSSAIAPLTLYRLSAPSQPVYGMQKPTFCIVAQGCKQATLGEEHHLHEPSRYLLVTVGLPITAQVIRASPEVPYLGFCLDLDPRDIGALLIEMDFAENGPRNYAGETSPRSLSISRTDAPLLDAVLRLLRLLDTPQDIPVLAPLALREILYRLLTGRTGRAAAPDRFEQQPDPTHRAGD